MIKFTANKFFVLFVLLLVLLDLSIILNNFTPWSSIITTFLLFTIPGFTILVLLRFKKLTFWKYLVFVIGLSLSTIIITGLIFNWLWYMFTNTAPLTRPLLFVLYNSVFVTLAVITYLRNYNYTFTLSVKFKVRSKLNILFFISPIGICLASIGGALTLNNGGTNILTFVSLVLIAINSLFILFFHKRLSPHIFPYTIYFFSLSLLLMLSLRSWYLSGWDVQDENRIYILTRDLGYWSPANIKHDYNSCLSISLFPAILNQLLNLKVEIIFKVIYQILFSIVPLCVYIISARFSKPIFGFFAAFYLIMQPFFIQPLIALMRQEIAFVFFAIMMLALFENSLGKRTRKIFVLVFGCSLVMSHYSTTYVGLILLLVTYLIISFWRIAVKLKLFNWIKRIKLFKDAPGVKHTYFISPDILLILFGFAIFWFSILNNTGTHASQVLENTLNDMRNMFHSESDNQEAKKAMEIVPQKQINARDLLNQYIAAQTEQFKFDGNPRYDPNTYSELPVFPVKPQVVQPFFYSEYNYYINFLFQMLKQLLKVFVFVGVVIIVLTKFKNSLYYREYIVLGVIASGFIAIMLLHPSLANNYNLSRFYLQSLIVLTLPAVIGGMFFFSFLKKYALYATGISFILMHIFFSGLVTQLLGGDPALQLNNKGVDYNKFYTHESEIRSAFWLEKNRARSRPIFMDNYANLRFRYASWYPTINVVLPQIIYKDSYVYSSVANTKENVTAAFQGGTEINYSFPTRFLNENKDVIYTNGSSIIYK